MSEQTRLTAWVHGYVQGVGFRGWTRSRALELGLTGYAANQADGRVLVVAQGSRPGCAQLLELLGGGTTALLVQIGVVLHCCSLSFLSSSLARLM